jgi:hypothetical protein
LKKTEHEMNFQLVFCAWKGFQMMARWWINEGMLEFFRGFGQKCKDEQMRFLERREFLCVMRLQLGFTMTENIFLYFCLGFANEVLIKFCSIDTIC